MKLRTFILVTSAMVGTVFLGGSWLAIGNSFESLFRDRAREQAEQVARITLASMYEVMSQGWTRDEAERFIASVRRASDDSGGLSVELYRGRLVEAEYGPIAQPASSERIRAAFDSGQRVDTLLAGKYLSVIPLKAEQRCLLCHENARAGDVLGVVEIGQPFERLLQHARIGFYTSAVPSLMLGLLLVCAAVAWVVSRISRSVTQVESSLDAISNLSDLRHLEVRHSTLDFSELNRIQDSITALATRLRSIAVDKDILMFEIGLLEKFVITSEVIRDWREYVSQLLQDINGILKAHVLFSVFQIDDELFDIEIFWHREPDEAARTHIERVVIDTLRADGRFSDPAALNVHHHFPEQDGAALDMDTDELELQIKSFFVESPKIGSIVGIGVHSDTLREPTHHLVLDSILSTLLNVVGSIKAIHKYARDLEYYATRDPLTDLYNQRVFWELLDYEIGRCRRHDTKATLLMIDLDNFKLINDHFGHAVGDEFLQRFSRAIEQALRTGDVFARYGGDEFVVLLPEADLEQGYAVANRVLEATRTVVVETGEQGRATASVSIGLAVYPDHASEPKDMFLFADTLMYKAKSEGKERVALPSEDDVMATFRNISETGVAVMEAINQRRIIPFFQPINHVAGQKPDAVEVLSRIEINGELMRADQFIEIAEKMSVIHRLDAVVIEAALDRVAASDFRGPVFFNLSPRALVLSEFTRTLRSVVRNSGVSPERIVFEITERDTVKNLGILERFFSDLKSEGFGLAIDDFGSGFSSFHYLRRFPFDYLKIEGDFIANMLHSDRDRIFVRSINDLARALDIQVIAEFVESEEVLSLLAELRIDYAQGYHVGRPSRDLPAPRSLLAPSAEGRPDARFAILDSSARA
ncbi:MAG: putative bifunctional diguanylate cyclase/phosphodiesterase [Rhodocyclaceae bacterium]